MSAYVNSGATISACKKYRYRLFREWRLHPLPAKWHMFTDEDGKPILDGEGKQWGEPLSCVFVMLNPSTAHATLDDPTIRRCVGFAKSLGYDRMEVVNLFAWRATNPAEVLAMGGGDTCPIGPDNQRHVQSALDNAGVIICAWGAHGGHLDQDETVLGWIEQYLDVNDMDVPIMALGVTKDGYPAHPLYLAGTSMPSPYAGRRS